MKWFRQFRTTRNKRSARSKRFHFRRLRGLESLEERRMLSGVPFAWAETTLDADVGEGLPDGLVPAQGPSLPMTTDAGDHYFYFDEQIDLLRALDRFAVGLESEVDIEDVVASLTGPGGSLQGYEFSNQLDDRKIVLSRPESIAYADIDLDDIELATGVAWAAPVFVGKDSGTLAIVTDEISVALASGVDPEEFFSTGYVSWEPFVGNQYLAIIADGGLAALDAANALSINEDVAWAQPNMYVDLQLFTNDPLFSNQWTLNNTSQFGAKNDADSDVQEAWSTTTGSSNVVIAVIDSGVQLNHPDLSIFVNTGEITGNGIDDDGNGFVDDVKGWDFYGVDTDALPDNDPSPGTTAADAHGTGVAGVAAAIGNNSTGVTGASQSSKILPVRVSGAGGFATNAVLARAVYYAAGAVLDGNEIIGTWDAADVINASWGGGMADAGLTAAFDWAATSAKGGKGIPVFVAAGNSAAGRQGSGTEQYGGPNNIGTTRNTTGLFSTFGAGTYSWVMSYKKDASGTLGEDTVRLGRFVNDDGANTRFDSTSAPSGWELTPFVDQNNNPLPGWYIEDNPARAYGTGRYQAFERHWQQ